MATWINKFPWLDQKYVQEIEQRTANVPAWAKEMLQQKMYSDFYTQQQREKEQAERLVIKNQLAQKEIEAKWEDKSALRLQQKKGNLADVIRNYYKLTVSDWDDDTLIDKFTNWIKNWTKMYVDYLNGDNNDIMLKTWLFWDKRNQLNEQQKVSNAIKWWATSTAIEAQKKTQGLTRLSSTSHFDDTEYANHFLQNAPEEYQPFIQAATDAGYPEWLVASMVDAKKTYDDFNDRGLGDKMEEANVWTFQWFVNFFGNAYNNLLWENPYVWVAPKLDMTNIEFASDLLGAGSNYGDLRAGSNWTKWGEIAGDLLANTAVMMLLPWMWGGVKMESLAESALENGTKWVLKNIGNRMIYWAAEWAEFGALATLGQENADLNKLGWNMAAWATLWSIFWWIWAWGNAYKYRNILKTLAKEWDKEWTIKGLLEMYNRWIKPTSQWVKTNTQLQQYNDDAMGAVESIIKNKDALKYVDANWEETFWHLPRSLDEFSQAIKQTKQSIYDRYAAIAKDAWKTTEVDTSNIVKTLKKQLKDKEKTSWWSEATKSRIASWIKDLEELGNKMSVEWTQEKIQELNQKLTAFLKNPNPNDVTTNAVDGLVLNWLKDSLDDAIERAGLDSEEYFQLRNMYKQLKSIESDVNHRAVVFWRQNPQSLVDSMSDLQTIDAIADIFTNPIWWTVKLVKTKAFKTLAKDKNNSDKIVENMFKDADDTIKKTDTLKSQTQIASERTQKQQMDIRKSREQRLEDMKRAREAILEKQRQQEQAYQEYLKSKWVWSETQALPQREWVTNYNTFLTDSWKPTVVTPEWTAIRPWQVAEINKPSTKTRGYVVNNLEKYKAAKVEYDEFLDGMASDIWGTPLKPDLKIMNADWSLREWGIKRVLEKASEKPNGVDDVTDIVRWTIAVKDQAWMNRALESIEQKWIKSDPKYKFDDKFSNPTELWYKDISFIYPAKNWVNAEVQINTPEMLVAKDGENAIKMRAVTREEYNAIVDKAGVEWGKGHEYYVEWRDIKEWIKNWSIDPVEWQASMDKIAEQSKEYYSKFENAGGEVGKWWTEIPTNPTKISWNPKNVDYNSYQWISKEIIDNGWITLDVLKKRNLWGKPYVAVSPYPNRSKIIKVNDFNDSQVFDYFKENADKLFEDGYALWGWVNEWNVYLDVSIALPKEMQKEAVDIANKYNQKAIFDLETFEDIPTAWNGEFMEVNEEEVSNYIKSLFNKKK